MRFGEYIRQCREEKGVSMKDLAELLSVDIPMLSRYERGLRPFKEEYLQIIANVLNLDPSDLRNRWIADKIYSVVNEEEDAADILSIVAENITEYKALRKR